MKLLKVLCLPYFAIRKLWRISIIKTLYLNFAYLPFCQAIKLPIVLYGKICIHSLKGKIIIDSDHIYHEMIKIGYRWWDLFPSSYLPTQLWIDGQLILGENIVISGGTGVFVQNRTASLRLGNKTRIGGGTMIKSLDEMVVGDYTRITGNCTIMNSNMHYVKNIDTGAVKKPWGKIFIGKYCWINSGSVVTKGTIVPDYSIVARNSFLNKDYSSFGESNLFIVGSPAKVLPSKVERLFKRDNERKCKLFFDKNPEAEEVLLTPGVNEESGDFEL